MRQRPKLLSNENINYFKSETTKSTGYSTTQYVLEIGTLEILSSTTVQIKQIRLEGGHDRHKGRYLERVGFRIYITVMRFSAGSKGRTATEWRGNPLAREHVLF